MFSKHAKKLTEVNKLIELLEGSLMGKEPWLKDVAVEINKNYRDARSAIRKNATIWSYLQYCECLSSHYYNLGLTYYKLFYENRIDLMSVRICLEKCLEEIGKIVQGNCEINSLKCDALKLLEVTDEIYKKQSKKFSENMLINARQCIILGKLDTCRTFLEQINGCAEEKGCFERQIYNIQLLRAANTVEDALTVPEVKNTLDTAMYSDYLSRLYRLTGNFSLSERYKRTAACLYSKPTESKKNICQENYLKKIVEEGITEYQTDVETVISGIMSIMTLSSTDCSIIKSMYIEHCTKLSKEEMTKCVEDLVKNRSGEYLEILKKIKDVKSLNDIPSPFNELKFCRLLMDHDHSNLISDTEKIIFLNNLKLLCKSEIDSCFKLHEEDILLLKAFINFLNSKNLSSVQWQLKSLCNGGITELLNGIMNLEVNSYEELKALQETIRDLKKECPADEIANKIREAIESYTKPAKLQIKNVNKQLIFEVTGKNLVISEILMQINNELVNNHEIVAVSFKATDILHIDANIEEDIWHGKNIDIVTKKIKIHGKVSWNVSGVAGEDYLNKAGTAEEGQGKQGKDGHPGESGGSVFIPVKEIENANNFIIISNGGAGGRGQDGGDGKDGKQGTGIELDDFKDKFPPVAPFLCLPLSFASDGEENHGVVPDISCPESYRRTNVRKTIQSIREFAPTIEIAWYSDMERDVSNKDILNQIFNDACNVRLNLEGNRNVGTVLFSGNIFIKAITYNGNAIFFSFEHGGFSFTRCQGFLLFTGSKGELGKEGGKCGLGGPGGYGGNITANKAFEISRNGEKAKDGNAGSNGLPGKHGWDMGYMDYCFGLDWPKFYGKKKNKKFNIEYYDSNADDRIYCPYQRFLKNAKEYAKFERKDIGYPTTEECETNASTKLNSHLERKCQTSAVHKAAILEDQILQEYSNLLKEDNALVRDAVSYFESIRNQIQNIKTLSVEEIKALSVEQNTLSMKVEYSTDVTSRSKHVTFNEVTSMKHKHSTNKSQISSGVEELKLKLKEARKSNKNAMKPKLEI